MTNHQGGPALVVCVTLLLCCLRHGSAFAEISLRSGSLAPLHRKRSLVLLLLTFDSNNTAIRKLIVYLELWAAKKEEYTRNKGNATGEFEWKVYEKCNGKKELKAGFVKEIEAREYASFLESCNKVAGYNESKFRVEYVPLVSEVQDEYDIWKAQFPKNLECAEIQHA